MVNMLQIQKKIDGSLVKAGTKLHLFLMLLSIVLLCIPGKTSTIGFYLSVTSLLWLPTTIESVSNLVRNPIVILLSLWWAFALLSKAWSEHVDHSLLTSISVLLIIPAIYPLKNKPKLIILSLGVGTAIHTVFQYLMWSDVIDGIRYAPWKISGGLHWYTPFTAMWSASVLFLLFGALLTEKTKMGLVWFGLLLFPPLVSLFLADNKTVYIITPLMVLLVAFKLKSFFYSKLHKRISVSVCSIILVSVLITLFIPGTRPNKRVAGLIKNASKITDFIIHNDNQSLENNEVDIFVSTFGLRYVWWVGGIEVWKESPWIGNGSGSTFYEFAKVESKLPTALAAGVEGFITPEPHSSLLATAIEQGLLGIMLMIGFATMAIVKSWKLASIVPALLGLNAAWLIVIFMGAVHTLQFSFYASTLIMILTVLSLVTPNWNKKPEKLSISFHAE